MSPAIHMRCCAAESAPSEHGRAHDHAKGKHNERLLSAMSDEASGSDGSVSTYGCPVCRKEHLLNLDKLQVRFCIAALRQLENLPL